jgi:hypothetical protein
MPAEIIPRDTRQKAGLDRVTSDGLRALMDRVRRDNQARRDRASVLAMIPDGAPLVLANNPSEPIATVMDNPALLRGVLISPSTEGAGWRISYFDDDGFSGHAIRETKEVAILTALRDGYTMEEPNLLRSLLRTERFQNGNASTERLQSRADRPAPTEGESLRSATAPTTASPPSRANPRGVRP